MKGSDSCCGLSWWRDANKSHSWRTRASSSRREPSRHFSLAVIQKATNNFDNACIIGRDSFGNIYNGCIDGGNTMVSIKRYTSNEGFNEFNTEIELLSLLRHPHLASLIGYCNQKNEMILVSDYMINGTLYSHLHGIGNKEPLPWKQRLEICIDAAKGLHFLHTGGKQTIIHRNVKSSNILLDEKWVAKISNFKFSLICPSGMPNARTETDSFAGTYGYLDPKYFRKLELTEKSDVYAFGVVLFEVLSARKAVDLRLDVEDHRLAEWAQSCIRNGTIDEIIDPCLMGRIAPVCLKEFVTIAKSCIRGNGIERPMMGELVEGLEFILQLQESADTANEENDSSDDNEYICRGMSFGESITSAYNEVISSQSGRVLTSSASERSFPSFDSGSVRWM